MDDWDGVGVAIAERLSELRMTQQELSVASGISPATIRELQHGRRRATRGRTLAALSTALGWHPGHLTAVLRGETPPDQAQAPERDPVLAELGAIRAELRELREQITQARASDTVDDRLDEISERISTLEARSAQDQGREQ